MAIMGIIALNLRCHKMQVTKMSVANIRVNNITAGPAEYLEADGIGYETRQSSFFFVFAIFFGLDRAQNRSCLLRTEELINRNVLVT